MRDAFVVHESFHRKVGDRGGEGGPREWHAAVVEHHGHDCDRPQVLYVGPDPFLLGLSFGSGDTRPWARSTLGGPILPLPPVPLASRIAADGNLGRPLVKALCFSWGSRGEDGRKERSSRMGVMWSRR
jgi:hypothetical protein